jgi:hypothetical protein
MTRIPDFHEEIDRFQNHIPRSIGNNLNRLRGKRAMWVRVLAGVAFIGAWCFLPLPIVGIWMLPVGLALLAHDIPMMRRPIARLLHFTNRKIEERNSENARKRTWRATFKDEKPECMGHPRDDSTNEHREKYASNDAQHGPD